MQKVLQVLLLLVFLPACAAPAAAPAGQVSEPAMPLPSATPIPELRPAPELHDGLWLNTDESIKLADLRGQVVLLEMWTFGCYNCRNVIPHIREWHESYQEQGLVVIGNHYPEFGYEADLGNLKQAVIDLDVPYPVLQDNERKTWSAYRNRYWPTTYLIDKAGIIRYIHIGEGGYAETESVIQALLAESAP